MRGWRSKSEAASKAEVVRRLLDPVRVVWGLTGTPIMAHVRDLWLQLQLVAKCWGEKPFTFHARYCGGGHRQIDTGNGGSVRAVRGGERGAYRKRRNVIDRARPGKARPPQRERGGCFTNIFGGGGETRIS